MTDKERSLKNYLVDRDFQLKIIGAFVGLFSITTLSLYSTLYLFFWNFKSKGLNVGIPEGHAYYDFLLNQKNDMDLFFIGLAFINLLLVVVVAFVVSHRIAAPIHKIKEFLKDPDTTEEIKLREQDFFQDLIPLVNQLKQNK